MSPQSSVIGRVMHVGEDYVYRDADGYAARALVLDVTRTLLLAVFAACAFLVWKAWRLKETPVNERKVS